MRTPKVSVIVPVHNCAATLERTVRSVLDQTLPADQIEIIAVNDGSTDGSGAALDELAAEHRHLRVIHQEASGGPGRPRNTGIDRAAGEYVFFLDADDHLAPEALERCCAMADANGTDVVVPKYVGVGRRVNPDLFRETVPFTTIFDTVPDLYGSLSALKLYRRSMLDAHGIRFSEGVLSGEDQIFVVRAYFEAKGVSVLADYDCYYWVSREDGTSALQVGGAPAATYFPEIERVLAFVTERMAPGESRDRLLRRHFRIEVLSRFDPRYQSFDERERRATRDAVRKLLEMYCTESIVRPLRPYPRLIAHALLRGADDLVDEAARAHAENSVETFLDGDRLFAAYPGFRDEALGVPDDVFDVGEYRDWRCRLTGTEWRDGRLVVRARRGVRTAEGTPPHVLLLRGRGGGETYRVPFRTEGAEEALVAEVDLGAVTGAGPLAAGRYDLFAGVRTPREDLEGRVVPLPGSGIAAPGPRIVPVAGGRPVVTPYLTASLGALALDVGRLLDEPAPVGPAKVSVKGAGKLRITAELGTAIAGEAGPVTVRVLLKHRKTAEVRSAGLAVDRRPGLLRVSGEIGMGDARRGKWDVSYEITAGPAVGAFRAVAADGLDESSARGRLRPFRTEHGNLSVECRDGQKRSPLRRWL